MLCCILLLSFYSIIHFLVIIPRGTESLMQGLTSGRRLVFLEFWLTNKWWNLYCYLYQLLIILFSPLFQEGLTIVESKTADIISETRKLHIRRKGSDLDTRNQTKSTTLRQPPQMQTDHETQLKASRDVRCQMCIIRSCRQCSILVGFVDRLTRSSASDQNRCLTM